jgi:hypothetical protein
VDDPDLVGSFTADAIDSDDALYDAPEIRSLAWALTERDQRAPHSLGVLGAHGSGKSFFAAQLSREIHRLSNASDEAACRNILQIRLDAWNLVGISPWISLTENMYAALDAIEDDSGLKTSKLLGSLPTARRLRHRLEARAQDANAALRAAAIEQEAIERRYTDAIQHEAEAKTASPWPQIGVEFRKSLTQASLDEIDRDGMKLGLSTLSQRPEDLYRLLDDTKTVGGTASILTNMRVARRYVRSTLLVLLAIGFISACATFAYFVLTSVKDLKDQVTAFFGALAGVTAVIGTAGVLLASLAQNQASRALARLQALSPILDAVVAAGQAQHNRHLVEATEKLDQLRTLVRESMQRTASAQRETAISERQLDEWQQKAFGKTIIDLYRNSQSFTTDADHHTSETLGLTIRDDMNTLSDLLTEYPYSYGETPDYPERIIVLIDNLDLCNNRTFHEYAEVTQQLLAFSVFSVVLVLDPRRLSREALDDQLMQLFDLCIWVNPQTIKSLHEETLARTDSMLTAAEIDLISQFAMVFKTPRQVRQVVSILTVLRFAHGRKPFQEEELSAILMHAAVFLTEPRAASAYFDTVIASNVNDLAELFSELAASGILSSELTEQLATIIASLLPPAQIAAVQAWAPAIRRFSLWP